MPSSRRFANAAVATIATTGAGLLLWSLNWGVGISPDSVTYLAGADSLARGHGFAIETSPGRFNPITHYPPLYPLLVSAVLIIGAGSAMAFKILNAVVFALNILVVGVTLIRITGGAIWPAVLGSVATMICFDMMFQHSWLLTDAVFVLIAMTSLVCLEQFVQSRSRTYFLAAVVLTSLACLTRYAGFGLVLAQALFVAFLDRRSPRVERLVRAAILVAGSLLPPALWLLRNHLVGGDLTDRSLSVHVITWQHVSMALPVLAKWLLPGVLGLAVLYLFRKYLGVRPRPKGIAVDSLEALLLLYMITYSMFLVTSITFVDAHTPLNGRTLLGLYPCAVILFISGGHKLCHPIAGRIGCRALIGLIFLGVGVGYGKESLDYVRYAHANGLGYASRQWAGSPTIAALHSYPESILVYSNGADLVRVLTRHYTIPIPRLMNPTSRQPNPVIQQQLAEMRDVLHSQEAVLVWFRALESRRWYLPRESDLVDALGVRAVRNFDDGVIYHSPVNSKNID